MLSKCANSTCFNRFLYLHHGKLFRIDMARPEPTVSGDKAHARHVEYFWLCSDCANRLTLTYREESGVIAVPLHRGKAASGQT